MKKKYLQDTNHRNFICLLDKFKSEHIYWKGIINDIQIYIKNCAICQSKIRAVIKKHFIKQMLFDKPRKRYIMNLSNLPDLIKAKTNYKYFLNVIDQYINYLFGELLTNRKSETIYYLNYRIYFILQVSQKKYVLIIAKNLKIE